MISGKLCFALCTTRLRDPDVFASVWAFLRAAKQRGYYVYVFTAGFDDAPGDSQTEMSRYSVFDLISPNTVDFMVVMNETIDNPMVMGILTAFAREHHIPMLSYAGKAEGLPSVWAERDMSAKLLIQHLVREHGCRRINMLTGIRGEYESESAVSVLRETLRTEGINFEPERVGYTRFREEDAFALTEQFISRDDPPEAIVTVAESDAAAVCEALARHGLRVPEDILVGCIEGRARERSHTPRISCCVTDYARMSAAALDAAEMILEGEDDRFQIAIPPQTRFSESCGCIVTQQRDCNDGLNALYRLLKQCTDQETAEHGLLSRALSLKQPAVTDYLNLLSGNVPEDGCLCLRDCLSAEAGEQSLQQFADPSELMQSLQVRRGEKRILVIGRAGLIPEPEKALAKTHAMIICPIFMLSEVYGYYAYYGENLELECFRCAKFSHTAGGVIGSGLITTRLQAMNDMLVESRVRDSLTGMLNLHGVTKELEERLQRENHKGEVLVTVVIGLRRLHQINSAFGRAEGDQALRSLVSAIHDCIDSNVIPARIGGDEFLLAFFSSTLRADTTRALLEVLTGRLKSYNQVSGKNYSVEIVTGQAHAPVDDSLDVSELIGEAIAAKEAQSKEHGGSKIKFSEKEAAEIETILNENLLTCHFQPIVRARDGQIYAYEALMRTTNGHNVSPLTILAYATETGRLYDVEKLTYSNVLSYMREHEAFFKDKYVFTNSIPGYFLSEPDFARLKERYGDLLPRLVVEFTEQAETEGEELASIQRRCEENGMAIAVDDYGTGYSNISNLLRYSPDYVKIDRSLITNIHEEPKKQHFVLNIIEFAHANNFMALAEGVETLEELRAVIRFGVDLIQGNYTAMPEETPADSILDEITAQMARFGATALKQVVTKTFMSSQERTLDLSDLATEKYTDIVVAQPELEVIGNFSSASLTRIKIKDDLKCRVILRNIYLKSQHPAPLITLGRNCDVTLEFDGDNRMDMGGILVPEGSTLHLTGRGNLSISVSDSKSFGIGNDADFGCGNIDIDLLGCLNIISNGDWCVGIGAGIGRGQKISVCGTTLFIRTTGTDGVGIGTLEDSCDIELAGCTAELDTQVAKSTAVGAQFGSPNIRCDTASLTVNASGKSIACIGSLEGGANITMRDSAVSAEVMGQSILVLGSENAAPSIALRECVLGVRCEGTRALDIGSFERDASVTLVDTDLSVFLRSATAVHLGSEDSRTVCTGGTQSLDINR